MRLAAIGVGLPSLEVSNQDVVESIGRLNLEQPSRVVARFQRAALTLLQRAGAERRRVRDTARGETAHDLVLGAVKSAVDQASMRPQNVDVLIYCGVGRGFLEPASAYLVASMLRIRPACFDVNDACMGWLRSLHIAQMLLRENPSLVIMIVNAECNYYDHGFPQVYRLSSIEQLAVRAPAFCVGECASATIVTGDDPEWQIAFESRPEHADLCAIPIDGWQDFVTRPQRFNQTGTGIFYAKGREMVAIAQSHMVEMLRRSVADLQTPAIWFPHVVSVEASRKVATALGVPTSKVFVDAFVQFGNLVSASLPAALSLATSENKLRRGDPVVLCPVSAGMSFGVAQFRY